MERNLFPRETPYSGTAFDLNVDTQVEVYIWIFEVWTLIGKLVGIMVNHVRNDDTP